jgi:hypothetical protein
MESKDVEKLKDRSGFLKSSTSLHNLRSISEASFWPRGQSNSVRNSSASKDNPNKLSRTTSKEDVKKVSRRSISQKPESQNRLHLSKSKSFDSLHGISKVKQLGMPTRKARSPIYRLFHHANARGEFDATPMFKFKHHEKGHDDCQSTASSNDELPGSGHASGASGASGVFSEKHGPASGVGSSVNLDEHHDHINRPMRSGSLLSKMFHKSTQNSTDHSPAVSLDRHAHSASAEDNARHQYIIHLFANGKQEEGSSSSKSVFKSHHKVQEDHHFFRDVYASLKRGSTHNSVHSHRGRGEESHAGHESGEESGTEDTTEHHSIFHFQPGTPLFHRKHASHTKDDTNDNDAPSASMKSPPPQKHSGRSELKEKYGKIDQVLGKGANAVVKLVCLRIFNIQGASQGSKYETGKEIRHQRV